MEYFSLKTGVYVVLEIGSFPTSNHDKVMIKIYLGFNDNYITK